MQQEKTIAIVAIKRGGYANIVNARFHNHLNNNGKNLCGVLPLPTPDVGKIYTGDTGVDLPTFFDAAEFRASKTGAPH